MGLLQFGIVVLAWMTLSALVIACAAAAGRADRRDARQRARRPVAVTPQVFPDPRPTWMRGRRVRSAQPRRQVADRRLRTTIH